MAKNSKASKSSKGTKSTVKTLEARLEAMETRVVKLETAMDHVLKAMAVMAKPEEPKSEKKPEIKPTVTMLPYRELQAKAKSLGIKANGKALDLAKAIADAEAKTAKKEEPKATKGKVDVSKLSYKELQQMGSKLGIKVVGVKADVLRKAIADASK